MGKAAVVADPAKVLQGVIDTLKQPGLRKAFTMLFVNEDVDEVLACRDILRNLRCVVSIDLEDQVSLVGAFDRLVDMAADGTFEDSLKNLERVVPKRKYNTSGKAKTEASTEESETEESEEVEETTEDSTAEEATA